MKNSHLGLFGIMVLLFGVMVSPISTSAQTYQQIISTDAGTLKMGISIEPASPKSGEQSKLKIDFLNPQTNQIQEHIDYTVLVTNNGNSVFGPIPLTHTSLGSATIPVQFKDGENKIVIDIQGILFRPIPSEKATLSVIIGDKPTTTLPKEESKVGDKPKSEVPSSNKKDVSKETKKPGKPKYDDIKKSSDSKYKKKDVKKEPKKDTKKKSDKKKPIKSTKSD